MLLVLRKILSRVCAKPCWPSRRLPSPRQLTRPRTELRTSWPSSRIRSYITWSHWPSRLLRSRPQRSSARSAIVTSWATLWPWSSTKRIICLRSMLARPLDVCRRRSDSPRQAGRSKSRRCSSSEDPDSPFEFLISFSTLEWQKPTSISKKLYLI